MEYPKIETLYNRNPENMKKVLVGEFRKPEFELVDRWLVTEKIDGQNCRVEYDYSWNRIIFRGRTDNANLHPQLIETLEALFPADKFQSLFPETERMTLYGEAYGPKIQSGGWYRDNMSFRLFDVRVGDWWLNWDNVVDVASKLGIETVPWLGNSTTENAILYVDLLSSVAALENGTDRTQEGIVCRTDPLLFDRRGDRVMWKLKVKDL